MLQSRSENKPLLNLSPSSMSALLLRTASRKDKSPWIPSYSVSTVHGSSPCVKPQPEFQDVTSRPDEQQVPELGRIIGEADTFHGPAVEESFGLPVQDLLEEQPKSPW